MAKSQESNFLNFCFRNQNSRQALLECELGCQRRRPVSLNDWGAITGIYIDANFVYHGYLRSPEGKIVTSTTWGRSQAIISTPTTLWRFSEVTSVRLPGLTHRRKD
jgi:hypothetical protein